MHKPIKMEEQENEEIIKYCQRCGEPMPFNSGNICGSCVDEIEHN
ncbi:MAG: hypothetical protein ACFFDN_50845 [Candidatus Hodarchaeota archaeon]